MKPLVMQRERERESYNLEDSVYFVCLNNVKNYLTGKLYLKYREQKVDMLKVGSINFKFKNLNDTS